MSRIDPELLARLASKLKVTEKHVYARIQKVGNSRHLSRRVAAIALAAEHNISIQKFLNRLTPQEQAELRGGNSSVFSFSQSSASNPTPATRSAASKPKGKSSKKTKDNSVFVVHGRNKALTRSMYDFLSALGLMPLEWSKALLLPRGANPQIEMILDKAMERVRAVVVLLSPDDEVKLKPEFCSRDEKKTEGKPQGQARPNVLFEAGLALGRHPDKTLLVQVGKVKGFSDVGGKHIAHLTNDFAKRNDVANRLEKIGCLVNRQGDHWMTAGNFVA